MYGRMRSCGHADFTGAAEERGSGPGLGSNYNFPLPTGTTDEMYCVTLQNAADVIGDYADIDYLIVRSVQHVVDKLSGIGLTFRVSLGVDTYADDPICDFRLSKDCYARIGMVIASLGKPTLFVMEG